jgi:hypothetical protein
MRATIDWVSRKRIEFPLIRSFMKTRHRYISAEITKEKELPLQEGRKYLPNLLRGLARIVIC